MHDFLEYMQCDPFFRKYHQNQLTFSFSYAYSEKYILVLSHDEVVHLRGDDPVVGQLTKGHGLRSDADVLGAVDEGVLIGGVAGVRHIRKEDLVLEDMRLDFVPQPPLGGQQIDCREYLGIGVTSVFDSFPEELTVDFACKIHGCYLAFWSVIGKQKSRLFSLENNRQGFWNM